MESTKVADPVSKAAFGAELVGAPVKVSGGVGEPVLGDDGLRLDGCPREESVVVGDPVTRLSLGLLLVGAPVEASSSVREPVVGEAEAMFDGTPE